MDHRYSISRLLPRVGEIDSTATRIRRNVDHLQRYVERKVKKEAAEFDSSTSSSSPLSSIMTNVDKPPEIGKFYLTVLGSAVGIIVLGFGHLWAMRRQIRS